MVWEDLERETRGGAGGGGRRARTLPAESRFEDLPHRQLRLPISLHSAYQPGSKQKLRWRNNVVKFTGLSPEEGYRAVGNRPMK